MTTVIIKRSKWARGNKFSPREEGIELQSNALLAGPKTARKRGTMCCLGFACLSRGVSPESILDKTMPHSTNLTLTGLTRHSDILGKKVNTLFSTEATGINDDLTISEAVRESKLKKLAAKHGFEFKFIP
jgi:hypothetical protein